MLLIFFHYLKILKPAESFLNQALKPVFKIFYSAGSAVSRTYRDNTVKQNLEERLRQAEADVNRLTVENAGLKFLEEENSLLRKQLNFLDKSSGRYVMADIISRGDLTGGIKGSQTIVINKGLSDGLFAGLAVTGSDSFGTSNRGVIVGKIIKVKDNIAEACLVNNKNCKIAAAILGEDKTSGIAQGELGLTVKMEFIPQTENIKVGDLVATSGLEEHIPRGLVIGRVSNVFKENNEVWQSAAIEPQLNLDAISIVAILLP